MTLSIVLVLGLLVVITILFAWDLVPAEVVAIGTMLFLILTGIVTPAEGFSGFSSDTVLMIAGLLVMSAALFQTGVVDATARFIIGWMGDRPRLLLPIIVVSVAVLSAFISNTAATAFFIPVVLGFALKSKVSPSRYLLPLAFASIVTSSATLISTSTNIVTSELLTRYGQPPLGMFELSPVGVIISIVGIAYLLTFGVRLMPDRGTGQEAAVDFGLSQYITDLIMLPDSPFVGKSLADSGLGTNLELNVLRIVRGGKSVPPRSSTIIKAADVLLVEGARENILKVQDTKGVEIKSDVKLLDPDVDPEDIMLAEAVILSPSPLIGRTLKSLHFRDRYELQVLAINRHTPVATKKLSETRLRSGDVLLLQGHAHDIQFMNEIGILRLIGSVEKANYHPQRAPLAVAIYAVSLGAATLKLASLPVATIAGAYLMLITKCITPSDAYRRMEWSVLILIGSMLSIGVAMDKTGSGKYLASMLIDTIGSGSPMILLAAFFVLAVALTQAMSNQAAAIVLIPIAVETAAHLGCNLRPLVMMIAIAASCSYLTPLEPSCLMVYGPGNYKFRDFFLVGWPLTLIIFLIAMIFVPIVWPL